MAFHSAKQSFTREDILDILRRNVKLYKNEPEFVNYIVDLALYLLENVAQGEQPAEEPEEREPGKIRVSANIEVERTGLAPTEERKLAEVAEVAGPKTPAPDEAESKMPRVQVDKGGRTRVYKVFRAHTQTSEAQHCPICGGETRGARVCPNCGNVL